MEHPDITAALRTGYPANCAGENRDTPEARADFIEEYMVELVRWLRIGYPEVLEEFIDLSAQLCPQSFSSWLN